MDGVWPWQPTTLGLVLLVRYLSAVHLVNGWLTQCMQYTTRRRCEMGRATTTHSYRFPQCCAFFCIYYYTPTTTTGPPTPFSRSALLSFHVKVKTCTMSNFRVSKCVNVEWERKVFTFRVSNWFLVRCRRNLLCRKWQVQRVIKGCKSKLTIPGHPRDPRSCRYPHHRRS